MWKSHSINTIDEINVRKRTTNEILNRYYESTGMWLNDGESWVILV